ncbi:FAD-binding domain-containing protein [Hypomontagnella submonticulosa]|nr:FAD-binding domain-containing protein [Hypomontagnella submonticulosa]
MTWLWLLLGATLSTLVGAAESFEPYLVDRTWNGTKYGCKCYIDDNCWPSKHSWGRINGTMDGNLRVHIPPGAACHTKLDSPLGSISTYDAAACDEARAMWSNESWTVDKPGAALWTYFTNDTCIPTTNPDEPCTLGYYGVYVVEAKTKNHVERGIAFARDNSLRLIIRNTGHDFIGRSTGWGSLIINMHAFQDVAFTTRYSGPGGYKGSAVTIGAGIQARQLLTLANAQNPPVTVVTGECPTVGVAGGLVQGGGHGPLTPLYGLLADTALSFEVVTADGQFRTANSEENSDLFWALKGGGPSTYGVVLSATLKTFPEQKSAGVILNINSTHTNDTEVFWEGVKTFHKYSNRYVSAGLYAYFELMALRLHVQPIVGVGKTSKEMQALVQPMFDELKAKGIPYSTVSKEFDTLFDLYIDLFEEETAGTSALTGGWMFTHEDVEDNNDGIIEAFKTVVSPREDLQNQGFLIGHLWDAGLNTKSNSATNPRFRKSTDFAIVALPVPIGATWAQKEDLQNVLTNIQDAAMKKAGPKGCAYINEGDPYQPNWQEHFWGSEYKKLLEIRKKYDPNGVFYAVATPGTEDWEVIEYGTRLCRRKDEE